MKSGEEKYGSLIIFTPVLFNTFTIRCSPLPLGTLKGSSNKVIVETDIFNGDKKYIIESPGAGPDVTAWGVKKRTPVKAEMEKRWRLQADILAEY